MRYSYPLILFVAILFAALGYQREIDPHRNADRSPASAEAPKVVEKQSSIDRIPASKPVAVQGDSLWPNAGERWIYRFERKASAEFGGKPWLNLKIGGRVAVEATESSGLAMHGENRFFLVSYEVDRLEMQGQTKTETRAFPGVRIEVDAAGKLRELRFATPREGATVTEEESDLVRDLTAQWLFFENHTRLGTADIEWAKEKGTVTKHVLRYTNRPEITKLDSNHEWVTGEADKMGAKVERIEGTENFTIGSPSGDFVQATSYRWLWTSTEKVDIRPDLALGAPFTIEETTLARESGVEHKVDPARIAREWPTLAGLVPHVRLKLFRDAKRALDGGANELVSLIVQDLKGKSPTSIEWRTGVGALASSSNPEAAAALLSLYREQGRTFDEKLSILSGVAAGEGAPAPDWKKTFEASLEAAPANPRTGSSASSGTGRIDDKTAAHFDPSRDYDPEAAVREASLYALGSSIRKETDASRRAELEAVLSHEVKEATTVKAQTAVLEAIGNSGSGNFYAFVKESSAATNPNVRAKAVAAVRFLASDLAKPIIDRAKADPVPAVRKVAEWSAKFQATAAPDSTE
jgi:hypothetical protein